MAKTGTFTVTTSWQAVQLDTADVTAGTYSVVNRSGKLVSVIVGRSLPTQSNGHVPMEDSGAAEKFRLLDGDKIYVKTDAGTALIGVVRA